jgi:hypothetical protein
VGQSTEKPGESVFILMTQCLQNSFFLEDDCQLCLPKRTVEQMLGGATDATTIEDFRRKIDRKMLETGPLYTFLKAVIDAKSREHELHIITIKDWHTNSPNYDQERRTYGTHCEADTFGAACLDGFEALLEPWSQLTDRQAQATAHQAALSDTGYRREGEVNHYYELRSDTLFDFQTDGGKLKRILDQIIPPASGQPRRVYIGVIGVYTDIKIMTLLTGLRSLYAIDNLIISDVLTASQTLERHLSGLDYCDKVLKVEIIHDLKDFAALFAPQHQPNIEVSPTIGTTDFRRYRSYYQDKQNVLAYQDAKLNEYIALSEQQAKAVYQQIRRTNTWLQWFGFGFLALTVLAGLLHLADPGRYGVEFPLVTGGLSLGQFILLFFTTTSKNLQSNLFNLVRLKNYLEAYSTIAGLLRHYFTRPELLQMQPKESPAEMLELLERQVRIFDSFAEQMNRNFGSIRGATSDAEAGSPPSEEGPMLPGTDSSTATPSGPTNAG